MGLSSKTELSPVHQELETKFGAVKYSLHPLLFVVLGFRVTTLTRFVEKIRATFVSPNKFIKKLDSKIYLMISIMHHKY